MNENLTPQIVAALLQDGTCKLTKAQMEAVVAPAVAALGKKYRFLGVAQPSTAPGSIPVPTLFVAVADGTYPSFSNQSVDGGDIAFFTSDDGGAWALTLIVSGGAGYVKKSDIVTSVSGSSTNKQVPGAKLLYDNYVQKSDVATLEVSNITTLTAEQLDALKVGDKVAKVTGVQKHLYVVTYKGAGVGEGICLTYVAAGYSETVSYDRTESGWAYNSTDIVPTPTNVPKPIVLTGLPTEAMTTQAELDAIGLTADEMAAAAQGLRTGVLADGIFLPIQRVYPGDAFTFGYVLFEGSGALSRAYEFGITFNDDAVEVIVTDY